MKTYTLHDLQSQLSKMHLGDCFELISEPFTWEYFDINAEFFFIKNTTSKLLIAIRRLV